MPYEFKMTRCVEFADTDLAGIVHFANFFRYMEQAEHAFYRALGFSVHQRTESGVIGWPRVQASCEFRHPVRFEDRIEVHLLVHEKKPKSISYLFVFRKLGDAEAQEVARGSMTVVCASKPHDGTTLKAIAIPPQIAAKLEPAPEHLLT